MDLISGDENLSSSPDWSELPYNTIINLFSMLTYRDRASLSSVCRRWRSLGASPCLWQSLDLRSHKLDISTANSLSNRCGSLQKLWFEGIESEEVIISLKANNLVELNTNFSDYNYAFNVDVTLSIIVARHEMLETIQLGPQWGRHINCDGIKAIGLCCPNLKKLWLYSVNYIRSEAIHTLASNCQRLINVAFMDCSGLDFEALTNIVSVRFLSLAGSDKLESDEVIEQLIKFPNLIALDVSRTKINSRGISKLLSCSLTLKVLCAIKCQALENDTNFNPNNVMGIELITMLTRVPVPMSLSPALNHEDNVMAWIEQVLSHSIIQIIESTLSQVGFFWDNQGAHLVTYLLKSSQEDVQERAIRVLAKFLIIDEEEKSLYIGRSNAIVDGGGIKFLLNLGKSSNENVQIDVAKVIFILGWDYTISSVIGKERGIQVCFNMVNSRNKIVVEETTRALKSLSELDANKKNVAETLANMASDEKISTEIIKNGGLKALSILTQECMSSSVLEKAVLAFANLAGIGYSNCENIELEHGLFQRLEQLILSPLDNVRQEAAIVLWNLSSNENILGLIQTHDLLGALWDQYSWWI
ncbi:protein ARABIDILLO 2-like [Impatiens glandulifera]|uniref:protein ARABIDILLO 2-like n=1 Tax=Impatiens glandulifera TaxID=253017 RepID=UPI001FB0B1A9|nr:protein ARABIDILLO 2-like [Impatiens glandulifera]